MANTIRAGKNFNVYIDLDTLELVFNFAVSGIKVKVPVNEAIKYGKVTWNKKAGETFKDVSKKKPPQEKII